MSNNRYELKSNGAPTEQEIHKSNRFNYWFSKMLPVIILFLVIGIGTGGYLLSISQIQTSNLESAIDAQARVAFEQCQSDNDTRELIGEVLDAIASIEREGETAAQQEDREKAFEEAKELLVINECPPRPENVDPGDIEELVED